MVGTCCAGGCGLGAEVVPMVGVVDAGWDVIDGEDWCPDCIHDRWTPRTDLSTAPATPDLIGVLKWP